MANAEYEQLDLNNADKDRKRNSLQDMLFGEDTAAGMIYDVKSNKNKRGDINNLKAVELEVFQVLARRGYSRDETVHIVANFMTNINRLS